MSLGIYKEVARGRWLIHEGVAMKLLPMALKILSGEQFSNDRRNFHDGDDMHMSDEQIAEMEMSRICGVISIDSYDIKYGAAELDKAMPNSLAHIKYHDVIIKENDGCGNPGTELLSRAILRAADNQNIDAIILDLDTPGGSAAAVQSPGAAINEARKKKPVLVYAGNGMVASAGYWIASQADEIYATYNTDEIGSIGTYMMMIDYELFVKNQYNTNAEAVYATKSTNKNRGYRDWQTGDSQYLIKNDLDPFNEAFHAAVRAGRGDRIKNEVFDGRLVMAEEALSFGLIDGIKTFAEVIDRARELSASVKSSKEGTQMKVFVKNMDNLIDAVNAGSQASAELISAANQELTETGMMLVSAEESSNLNNQIAQMRTDNENLAASVQQLTQANETGTAALASIRQTLGLSEDSSAEDINSAISAIISQRDEYGQKAGIVPHAESNADPSAANPSEFTDPSLAYAENQFGQFNTNK